MRLNLERRGTYGDSLVGVLRGVGGRPLGMTVERRWQDNERGRSAVPPGFYVLQPHDGEQYRGTWALVGETVSHVEEPGVPRFACVLHWSTTGAGLQGCVCVASELRIQGDYVVAHGNQVPSVIELLRQSSGPHYLTIREALA